MLSIRAKYHLYKSPFNVILKSVVIPSSSSATLWLPSRTATTTSHGDTSDGLSRSSKEAMAWSFKEWFKCRKNAVLAEIFKILRRSTKDNDLSPGRSADLALSNLGFKLNEAFVLEVLKYGIVSDDVLPCLKFFDWAGRQPGFHHTRATFYAIFKIISRAKLMSLMLDFLDSYAWQKGAYRLRFQSTLVVGYAVVGKLDLALQLLGGMRFNGLDLDSFGYNVLLNALVENGRFDAVRMISKQIQMRGFENEITRAVMMKSFCKQMLLDKAEAYFREVVDQGLDRSGYVLRILVDHLCRCSKFDRAGKLIEEFRELGITPMKQAYDVWLKNLVHTGRVVDAFRFLKEQKAINGYVPSVFRYNMLICRLLWENRLEEACELLIEMKESKISPDEVTMNAALCFFCKAGMVSSALDLYNSRSEFGLSPNSVAYNYLINTLWGDGSIDQAYSVLQDSIEQGYFPGEKAFSILTDGFCRERKLDKMKELLLFALDRNVMPSSSAYDTFISALCKANRLEDGYLIYDQVSKLKQDTARSTYVRLIVGFSRSNKGDIAARLFMEMKERGYKPSRMLYGTVIRCLCQMENPEEQFFKFLKLHMSRDGPSSELYNLFIYGAGVAKKPELAAEVYEMMRISGMGPNLISDILMLTSYLKSDRISDAVNFFNNLLDGKSFGRRLWNSMITGLCKVDRLDVALELFNEMKNNGVNPTIECYELLIKLLCSKGRYNRAITLLNEFIKAGRVLTPFMGNTFLCHSLQGQELFNAWTHQMENKNEKSENWMLGLLIGAFSGRVRFTEHIENLDEVIEKCFPADLFTYNMLLRKISLINIDSACEMFHRMCRRGYQPNQWTYDILVHGFLKHGRKREAGRLFEEMLGKGFYPSKATTMLISWYSNESPV